MNANETRALYAKGRDAWNEWARGILDRRAALKNRPDATETRDELARLGKQSSIGINDELLGSNPNFDGFIFPDGLVLTAKGMAGALQIAGGKFYGPARFESLQNLSAFNISRAHFYDSLTIANLTTRSLVDMQGVICERDCVLGNIIAPDAVNVDGATFRQGVSFDGLRARAFNIGATSVGGDLKLKKLNATNVILPSRVVGALDMEDVQCERLVAEGIQVEGKTHLSSLRISDAGDFREAQFLAECVWFHCVFNQRVDFTGATFHGPVRVEGGTSFTAPVFDNATFGKDVTCTGVSFRNRASFLATTFRASVDFSRCVWSGGATFDDARFNGVALFVGCREGGDGFRMNGATFASAPDFLESNLGGKPRFDGAKVKQPWPWSWARDRHEAARYRQLKEFALQRHDHAQESHFLAGEMRARRFYEDHWWRRNVARFYLGQVYGGLSDFGQSAWRPFAFWFFNLAGFGALYLHLGVGVWNGCSNGVHGVPWQRALYLSLSNALFFGIGKGQEIAAAYECLYIGGAAPVGVAFAIIGQTALSALLLFFFFLAVRNQFRIK